MLKVRFVSVLLIAAVGGSLVGCNRYEAAVPKSGPVPVVVWISVDGLRGDYIDRADVPFLKRLMAEGAYSRRATPGFPSLTFPAHVSQATGALVKDHGIVANALYDIQNDRKWSYPNDNSAILCEPIWNTAKRQGRRSAVFDWPTSQNQTGSYAADHFDDAYDTGLPDEQRLGRLWQAWAGDKESKPLQLLMGYFPGVDSAGHKHGPNSPEVKAALEKADRLLEKAFVRCQELVKQKLGDDAVLYFIISTDHGMDDVHTLVSLNGLLGDALTPEMRSVTCGSIANIHLDFVKDPEAKRPLAVNIVKTLTRYDFAEAHLRENLPPEWGYDRPGRTGDVVVSIAPGYYFTEKGEAPVEPVDPKEGPLGMHGYPLADSAAMFGMLVIWRSGEPIGGIDLGELESRRLHSTVAKMLGIVPAETALNEPLPNVVLEAVNTTGSAAR